MFIYDLSKTLKMNKCMEMILKPRKKILHQLESVSKQYKTNHLNIFDEFVDVWDAFVFQLHNITLDWKVFY